MKHNAKNLYCKLEHNHLLDLTNDEFKKFNYLGERSCNKEKISNEKKELVCKFNILARTQQSCTLKEYDWAQDY